MLKKQTKKDLLFLADYLEKNVHKKNFDMGTFGTEKGCGTVACSGGHSATIPRFRRRGLKLIRYDPLILPHMKNEFYVYYKKQRYLFALGLFFGISQIEANYLFIPDFYPPGISPMSPKWRKTLISKEMVIDRIRQFVKHGGIPK